jgi:hypothetical protein
MSRATYLQVTALYTLDEACRTINEAFDSTCYLVGSSTERADYRDVDVRVMLPEETFDVLFPGCPPDPAVTPASDPYWSLVCVAISEHLSRQTGLPIDFQVQRRDEANRLYSKPRHPLGIIRGRGRARNKRPA